MISAPRGAGTQPYNASHAPRSSTEHDNPQNLGYPPSNNSFAQASGEPPAIARHSVQHTHDQLGPPPHNTASAIPGSNSGLPEQSSVHSLNTSSTMLGSNLQPLHSLSNVTGSTPPSSNTHVPHVSGDVANSAVSGLANTHLNSHNNLRDNTSTPEPNFAPTAGESNRNHPSHANLTLLSMPENSHTSSHNHTPAFAPTCAPKAEGCNSHDSAPSVAVNSHANLQDHTAAFAPSCTSRSSSEGRVSNAFNASLAASVSMDGRDGVSVGFLVKVFDKINENVMLAEEQVCVCVYIYI
jgi:hypothetical protein